MSTFTSGKGYLNVQLVKSFATTSGGNANNQVLRRLQQTLLFHNQVLRRVQQTLLFPKLDSET